MRCPKCGYISFDHVDTCLKCNKDMSKAAKVEGTTYNVAPPSFLRFTKRTDHKLEEKSEIDFDPDEDEFGVIDPDLDVLVDDEEDSDGASIAFDGELDGFGALDEEESFEIAGSDDEDEEGIDLGQFEDAFEEEVPEDSDEGISLDFPDELSDISDLSAPAGEANEPEQEASGSRPEAAPSSTASTDTDDVDEFNLDLDLEDLSDDFSLTENDEQGGAQADDEDDLGDLSLDDLGLSDNEEEQKPVEQPKKPKDGKMDMDADLDFDLDLGGVSLDDED